ncbi:MAG: hypothetical protein WBC63_10050 [Candidatus Bipolaricaulia bacterium]
MTKAAQTAVLVLISILLIAILATLITIAWRGVRIEHTGTVAFGGIVDEIPLRMSAPITLTMPEPAHLITTGPDAEAIPVDLALLTCPSCGSTMVPARWNLWTGEIDWICPNCRETVTAAP